MRKNRAKYPKRVMQQNINKYKNLYNRQAQKTKEKYWKTTLET